jgi:hypothetical protein
LDGLFTHLIVFTVTIPDDAEEAQTNYVPLIEQADKIKFASKFPECLGQLEGDSSCHCTVNNQPQAGRARRTKGDRTTSTSAQTPSSANPEKFSPSKEREERDQYSKGGANGDSPGTPGSHPRSIQRKGTFNNNDGTAKIRRTVKIVEKEKSDVDKDKKRTTTTKDK